LLLYLIKYGNGKLITRKSANAINKLSEDDFNE